MFKDRLRQCLGPPYPWLDGLELVLLESEEIESPLERVIPVAEATVRVLPAEIVEELGFVFVRKMFFPLERPEIVTEDISLEISKILVPPSAE